MKKGISMKHTEYTGRLTPEEMELVRKEFKNSGITLNRLRIWLSDHNFDTYNSSLSRFYTGATEFPPVIAVATYHVTHNPALAIIEQRYGTGNARALLGIEGAPVTTSTDEMSRVFEEKRTYLNDKLTEAYARCKTFSEKGELLDSIEDLVNTVSAKTAETK